jgi:hypothetical protein
VAIISERNEILVDDLMFAFGKFMLPSLIVRYPYLLEGVDSFLALLQSIDSVIHEPCMHRGGITAVFLSRLSHLLKIPLVQRKQPSMTDQAHEVA